MAGRMKAMIASITPVQINACAHIGGENISSKAHASGTMVNPNRKIIKTAAPSPMSCAPRSASQTSHFSATVIERGLKSFP